MGATENKQLMHQIVEELSKGNSEPFVASMADDFRWTVTGTTKSSRTYEGTHSVLVELFGALRARINGRIRTMAHRLIAEGDYAVVEARGSNMTKSGLPKRGKFGGWFAEPQHKRDFRSLTKKLKEQLAGQFPNATKSDWREVADWLFGAAPR